MYKFKTNYYGLILLLLTVTSNSFAAHSEKHKFYLNVVKGNLDEVVLYLEKGNDINDAIRFSDTALIAASERNQFVIVKYLLTRGAKVNLSNEHNDTPLFFASGGDSTELVKLLLKFGADVNIESDKGQSPLSKTIGSGEYEQMKLLIEHGANVNVTDQWGNTPLMKAAESADISLVRLMLEKGAKVNVVERGVSFTNFNPMKTALRGAVKKHRPEVVKLLLDYGANAHIPDGKDRTPVQWAEYFEYKDILKIFSDYNVLKPKR